MNLGMIIQSTCLIEPFPTILTYIRFLICMNSFVVCSNYLHEKSHFHIPHKNICLPLNDCSDGFCNQNSCRILCYKYHRCDLQLSRGFSLCDIPIDSFCQISALPPSRMHFIPYLSYNFSQFSKLAK